MTSLPSERPIAPVYWHVVFMSRPFLHWFDIFSKPWCRHVCAYAWCVNNQKWLLYNPEMTLSTIAVLSDGDMTQWLESLTERVTCRVVVKVGQGSFWRSRGLRTCSSDVLRVLGLRGGALRPQDLYRTLLANGGVVKEDKR